MIPHFAARHGKATRGEVTPHAPATTLSTWQLKNRCAFLFSVSVSFSLSLFFSVPSEALRRIEIASRNAIEIGTGHGTGSMGQVKGSLVYSYLAKSKHKVSDLLAAAVLATCKTKGKSSLIF